MYIIFFKTIYIYMYVLDSIYIIYYKYGIIYIYTNMFIRYNNIYIYNIYI